MPDIDAIQFFMRSNWCNKTYKDGLDEIRSERINSIRDEIITVMEHPELRLNEKRMKGDSVEGLLWYREAERNSHGIVYAKIFQFLIDHYFTPAYYVAEIVRSCHNENLIEDRDLTAGLVARGLRSLPAFLREMDLECKLMSRLPGAAVKRNIKNDVRYKTDILLTWNHTDYRIMSYQGTEKGVANAVEKIRGNRSEEGLPKGIYVLCPFEFRTRNLEENTDWENCGNWMFHSKKYIDMVAECINGGACNTYKEVVQLCDGFKREYVSYKEHEDKVHFDRVERAAEYFRMIHKFEVK